MPKPKRKFDLTSFSRKRPVAWDASAKKALTHDQFYDDDGKLSQKMVDQYKVDPSKLKPITLADLPDAYRADAKSAIAALAAERGWQADQTVWDLVLTAKLQMAVNTELAAIRPGGSDPDALAASLRKALQRLGKSDAEIATAFRTLGVQG
jgi:hypothetical protein